MSKSPNSKARVLMDGLTAVVLSLAVTLGVVFVGNWLVSLTTGVNVLGASNAAGASKTLMAASQLILALSCFLGAGLAIVIFQTLRAWASEEREARDVEALEERRAEVTDAFFAIGREAYLERARELAEELAGTTKSSREGIPAVLRLANEALELTRKSAHRMAKQRLLLAKILEPLPREELDVVIVSGNAIWTSPDDQSVKPLTQATPGGHKRSKSITGDNN